jgi:DNA-binding transcriptional LysR family regulator
LFSADIRAVRAPKLDLRPESQAVQEADKITLAPFAFTVAGKVQERTLPAVITVTGPETNVASACAGLGLIQVPRYRVASELASGSLVEVLQEFPPSPLPVHVLYSHAPAFGAPSRVHRLDGRAVP